MKPGSCTLPCFGIDAVVLDSQVRGITGHPKPRTLPCPPLSLTPPHPTTTLCSSRQTGKEIEGNDVEGVLAIKQPWPGVTRTCLGDHERYLNVYMKVRNDIRVGRLGYYFAKT
jgi:acetyl-CoA synthetase